jgi:hypothetical protein
MVSNIGLLLYMYVSFICSPFLLALYRLCGIFKLCPLFGPKRDDMTKDWRKFHNEQLHSLYLFPNITRQIKSRLVRWQGMLARGFVWLRMGTGDELL